MTTKPTRKPRARQDLQGHDHIGLQRLQQQEEGRLCLSGPRPPPCKVGLCCLQITPKPPSSLLSSVASDRAGSVGAAGSPCTLSTVLTAACPIVFRAEHS